MTDTSNSQEAIPLPPDTQEKPINIVEEAKLVRDDILKQKEELTEERKRIENLKSEAILSGNTGAPVETKTISPEQQKVKDAEEMFKGTALGEDIKKANE